MNLMTVEQQEHCLAMADAIGARPEGYRQRTELYDCGSTACLAGWSLVVKHHNGVIPVEGFQEKNLGDTVYEEAASYMGLDKGGAEEAFDFDPWWSKYGRPPGPGDAMYSLKEYVRNGWWKWLREPKRGE